MSAFWRDPAGFTLGNESKAALVAPPDMARFRTTGQKLQISFSGQPYKDLALVASDIPIDGAFPEGMGTELQARGSATTFKRVTNSGTAGANVTLGGVLTLDAAGTMDRSIVLSALATVPEASIKLTQYHTSPQPILLQFDRARGLVTGANPIQDNDVIGELKFRGFRDGAFQNFGYVRTAWNLNDGGYIEVGSGGSTTPGVLGTTGARLTVTQNVGVGIAGTNGYYAVVVDNVANVVTGVGSMPTTSTAGFLWAPQALGLPTAAPNPNKFGWKPVVFVGDALHTWDGTRWKPLGETTYTAEWRFSTLMGGEPANGFFRGNGAAFDTNTALAFAEQNNDGVDTSTAWDRLVPGDVVYFQEKDDATHWARYEISGPVVDTGTARAFPVTVVGANGTIANNQVCIVRLIAGGGGSTGGGGGVTNPGGVATEVQYKLNATTFGGIGYSSVTGANVRFGGSLTSDNATPTVAASKAFIINPTGTDLGVVLGESSTTTNPILMQIQRSRGVGGAPEAVIKGDWVGKISFEGWQGVGEGSGLVPMGYLQSLWDGADTADLGNVVTLGAGGAGEARVVLNQKSATSTSITLAVGDGTKPYFQVQSAGFQFSHGNPGAVYYKDAAGYFSALNIVTPDDVDKALIVTDIGGGVLMPQWVARTGLPLPLNEVLDPEGDCGWSLHDYQVGFEFDATQPNEDSFVIQSIDGAVGTGVVLLVRTGTGSSKAPFRVATGGAAGPTVFGVNSVGKVGVGAIAPTFNTDASHNLNVFGNSRFGGAVRNEQVSAESMVIVKQSTTAGAVNNPALLQFSRAGDGLADLVSGDVAGRIEFYGKLGGYVYLGSLDASYDSTLGNVITLGAGVPGQARLQVTQSATVGAVEMRVGSYYIQVNTAGIAMAGGTTGSIYYKGDPTYLHVLDINPATDSGKVLTVAEDTVGSGIWYPRWKTLTATGAFPVGDGMELQARNSGSSFKPVLLSVASGPDITLGGLLKLNSGGSNNQSIVWSALTGAVTSMSLTEYREADQLPSVIQFNRARGIVDMPVVLQDDDQIGELRFVGYVGTTPTWLWMGGIRGSWNTANGLIVETGAGLARVTVMQNFGVQLAAPAGGHTFSVASSGFTFSHGTRGALYWKNETGLFVPLPVGTAGQVVTAVEVSPGIREPQYTTIAASGAFPVGTGSELQARNTDFSFKKVDSSVVTGADIQIGGHFRLSSTTGKTIYFHRTAEAANTFEMGRIQFLAGAAENDFGYFRSYYTTDYGLGNVVEMGHGDGLGKRIYLSPIAATIEIGSYFFQVLSGGVRTTGGAQGSLLYQDGPLLYWTPLPLTAGFLKSDGTRPVWSAITMTDVGGVLPITKGGTGLNTPPTAGQLLIGKSDGSYNLATLTQGLNITIANGDAGTITISGAASVATPPGGSAPQLQYNTGSGFGGVSGSSVDTTNVGLQGSFGLAASSTYQTIYFDRTNAGADVTNTQVVGQILFRGQLSGAPANMGFVRGWYDNALGGVVHAGHSDTVGLFVYPVAVQMKVGTYYFQVQTDGYRIKGGTHGAIYYQSGPVDGEYFVPLAIQPGFLKNVGGTPDWELITWADLSGVLPITQGGTGYGTAPIAPFGQILRAESASEYRPATLVQGSGISINNVSGTITIACTVVPGGGAFPVGAANTLQAVDVVNTSFKALTGSIVSGADLTLGGRLDLGSGANEQIILQRVGTIDEGTVCSRIMLWGNAGGMRQLGYFQSYWQATYGAWTDIGAGAIGGTNARVQITNDGATTQTVTLLAGTLASPYYFQVNNSGYRFKGGAHGSIWYSSGALGSEFFVPLTIKPGVLKNVGGTPDWVLLTLADVASGILPITQGGTGYGTAPVAGQLLRAESASEYRPATLAQGAGIVITNNSGLITIASNVAAGIPPVGNPGELQAKNDGPGFVALTDSMVTGSDLKIGGHFSIHSATGRNITLYRNTETTNNQEAGKLQFFGTRTSQTDFGYVRSYWTDAAGVNLEMGIGTGISKRIYITPSAIMLEGLGHFFQVSSGGIRISGGAVGSIYFQEQGPGVLIYTPLDIGGSGTFLKALATGRPGWASITMTDVGGILPITKGGTGWGTQPTLVGQLLRSEGSPFTEYRPATLIQGPGIQIDNVSGSITITCTVTPGGGAFPVGENGTLQYRASSATFGSVVGSAVVGDINVRLAGWLELTSLNAACGFYLDRNLGSTEMVGGDEVGRIHFRGQHSSGPAGVATTGWIRSYWHGTLFGHIEMAATTTAYLEIHPTAATLKVGATHFIQVQTTGLRISGGQHGSIWYQEGAPGSDAYTALTIQPGFLKNVSGKPGWALLTVDDIGGVGGVLPIAKGGTGYSTEPTVAGQLLRAESPGPSAQYRPATLAQGFGISISNNSGLITITNSAPGTGATPPGGDSGELQYHTGTGFGGLDGSGVAGRHLTLGGDVTISDPGHRSIVFERTSDVLEDENVGAIWFRRAGVTPTYYGFLRAFRNDDQGGFNIQLSRDLAGSQHLLINGLAATLAFGSKYITIQSTGIQITVGTTNSLLYQTGSSIQGIAPSLTSGWFLKSTGGLPFWAAVTIDDVGGVSGVLPISKGGTGGTTAPTIVGQILRADGTGVTSYSPATLVGTGTVSVNHTTPGQITIVGTGGSATPPVGSSTELQYRKLDGTAFQPVTGSTVDTSGNINLTGYVAWNGPDQRMTLIATGSIVAGSVGRVRFEGRGAGGSLYEYGVLESAWHASWGAYLSLQARDGTTVYVKENEGISLFDASGFYFSVGPTGFYFNQGAKGDLWYNHEGTQLFTPLPIAGTGGRFLKSDGVKPFWDPFSAADITGATSGYLLIGNSGGTYTSAPLQGSTNIGITANSGALQVLFQNILPIANGGLGYNSTPTANRILRADGSGYLPVVIAGTGTVSVDHTTTPGQITLVGSAGAAPTLPGGSSGTPLQYRKSDGTAFEAVGTSGVTAAGWVGIGTTTPAVRFNVVGDTQLQSSIFTFQVQSAGFLFSGGGGGFGSLYYRDYYGYFVPTLENPSATAKIPFWDSTYVTGHPANGALRWLTLGTNLSIAGTTLNAASGTGTTNPGTPLNSLQWNSGSTFAGLSSSRVGTVVNPGFPNAADVAFGGGIYLDDAGSDASQEFVLSATSLGPTRMVLRSYKNDTVVGSYIQFERGKGTQSVWSALTGGEVIAEFRFVGQLATYPTNSPTSLGTIQSFYSASFGGVMRVMARTAAATSTPASYVELTDNGAGTVNATLQAGSHYIQMQAGGIRLSVGDTTTGGLLYQTGSQSIAAEPLPSAATDPGEVYVLRHDGIKPYWGPSPVVGGTTPPGGSLWQLQFHNSGTVFGGISGGTSGHFLKSAGTGAAPAFAAISATTDVTAAGSTTELQYRNSSTGKFAPVFSSAVDISGNITLGSGLLTVQSDAAGAKLNLKAYTYGDGPTIYTERSLNTSGSKVGLTAGYALLTVDCRGYDNTLQLRYGMALDVGAQGTWTTTSNPTAIRVRTTPVNSLTPGGRMLIGGSKVLARDTLTELFRINYTNLTEHSGMAGEIHLVMVVKGFHTITHTGVYKRKIKFAFFHNGANNTAAFIAQEDASAETNVLTSGQGVTLSKFNHGINAQAHPGVPTGGSPLFDSGVSGTGNEIIYKVLFETTMATVYSIVCYYHVIYHGENELAMAVAT